MNIFDYFRKSSLPAAPPILPEIVTTESLGKFNSFFTDFAESLKRLPRWGALLLVHGDAFLKKTPWEGGIISEQSHLFDSFFKTVKMHPKSPLNPEINPEAFDFLCRLNESTMSFQDVRGDDPRELAHRLHKAITNNGAAFLGLSYMGKEGTSGHAFGVYIERNKKNQLICHFLNRGEGLNLNRRETVTHQERFALSFSPIRLNDPEFFCRDLPDEETVHFLKQLMKFQTMTPGNKEPEYHSQEIYNVFLKIGSVSGSVPSSYGALSPQRSGTCADQAVRLMARFALEKCSPDHQTAILDYKRLMFAYKAYSLLVMGVKLAKEGGDAPISFVKESSAEFALASRKRVEAGWLTPSEYEFSVALCSWVDVRIKEARVPAPIQELASPLSKARKPLVLEQIPNGGMSQSRVSYKTSQKPIVKIQELTPNNLLQFLKAIPDHWEGSGQLLYERLPIPLYENDPFWDEIPQAELEECLSVFIQYVNEFQDRTTPRAQLGLLYQLTVLSVADKLIRRTEESAMRGRSFYIFAELVNPSIIYFSGRDTVRFNGLMEYFKTTAARNPKPLFGYFKKQTLENCISEFQRVREREHGNSFFYQWEFLEEIAGSPWNPAEQGYIDYVGNLFNTNRSSNYPWKGLWENHYKFLEGLCRNLQSSITEGSLPTNGRLEYHATVVFNTRYGTGVLSGNAWEYIKSPTQQKFGPNFKRFNNLLDSPFSRIFAELKALPENQVAVKPPLKDENASFYGDDTYRIIGLAKQSNVLRVASAVKYMDENFFEAKAAKIFNALEWVILAGTNLIESVRQEPLLANGLRDVLDKHLDFDLKSCNSNWNAFLR